ncbi:MAG: hypothetical protein JWR55_1776 [Aeromicrobium sp.]|nr:hypothetical protein [Aeromicrobium sp.]
MLATAGLGLVPTPASTAAVTDEVACPELPCVVITYVETKFGKDKTLSEKIVTAAELRDLAATDGLGNAPYTLRKNPASKGGRAQKGIAKGDRVGISALLAEAGSPSLGKETYVETPNLAGVPAVLSAGDLVDPDADLNGDGKPDVTDYPFYDQLQPAVFITGSGKLGYVRPLRDLDEDTNASDYFQVADRLDITVHTTGKLLTPTVTSSAGTSLERGAKTTFEVSYAEKTGIRSVVWDFGDGSVKSTTRESPTKSYAKKGTYPVAAMVRTNDGSYGRSSAVEIKVANPPKAPTSGTGGGTGGGGSGSGGGVIGGGGTLPPYDPFPSDLSPPSENEIEEPPVEEEVEQPPVDDGLVPVEGFVLAGAEIVPGGTPETIPGTENTATPAPATQQAMRTRVATWITAILAAALLIGIGAASETRWFRHRLRHLRRRA